MTVNAAATAEPQIDEAGERAGHDVRAQPEVLASCSTKGTTLATVKRAR